MRKLLVFGAGATLAIAQLGAGCVPLDRGNLRCDGDASVDEAGNCPTPPKKADGGKGGDAQ